MNLTKLIADAWEQEWAKYRLLGIGGGQWRLATKLSQDAIAEGAERHCISHLSSLCALAVLRALQEAGMIIAKPEWEYGDNGGQEWSYDNLIPAALEQP